MAATRRKGAPSPVLYLPTLEPPPPPPAPRPAPPPPGFDPRDYDLVVAAFSGGADSTDTVLELLERGVDPARIELHHHLVDGREGSDLFDWPVTEDYVRAFGRAFGMRVFYSWRVGGLEREMLRENARTAPVRYETYEGTVAEAGGTGGGISTRLRYPQVSDDLSVRWCSPYGKIMVLDAVLCNEPRFRGRRTLVCTGERAEESTGRAGYAVFEPHRSDLRDGKRYKRHIDHWRPVHARTRAQVWERIARWRINPHPAYRILGRCSCAQCIFMSDNQAATLHRINPGQTVQHIAYERRLGVTIARTRSLEERIARGVPFPNLQEGDIRALLSVRFDEPIILPEGEWRLPAGAFGESCGPG